MEIALDGVAWRIVPLEAIYRVGLDVGVELDRSRARALRRELLRHEALGVALSALRRRDHATATLQQRLARRGIRTRERQSTVETLARAGLVDDARFAHARAGTLAARGAGNYLVAHDLETHGVGQEDAHAAIAALEPESVRAARIIAQRGATAKTLRYLAAKGFDMGALDVAVADVDP